MSEHQLMINAIIYMAAAVIAVLVAKRLGLGSVIGYLIAGVSIGPWGMGLIANVDDILHFAEIGVVLLLFLIGLELNPKRLWAMRRSILGMGGLQVLSTTLVLLVIGLLAGLPINSAMLIAMALSLSSTAIALQTLTEKNLLTTHAGSSVFSILLFQDIAVIPMLALIPFLGGATGSSGDTLTGLLKVIAAIAGIVVLGHYLTRPIFRYIAKTGLREIFTAFTLLLVIGIALLMDLVDLSMAMGTFLAGVLLAESEYRHELEVEIEPFKGLLLGLFFIAVGMSIDFGVFLDSPFLIFALVTGLITVKLLLLWLIAARCATPITASQRPLFAFLLCQGGEFAFVLFTAARGAGVIDEAINGPLIAVVALSMVATPLLLILYERIIAPGHVELGDAHEPERIDEPPENPVIIAGFGRFGRIIGRLLHANRISSTILDHDPDHIEQVRKFGYKVYYGDATRLEVLRTAGAGKARLLIITIDDPQAALTIVDIVKNQFPELKIVSRAHDLPHAFELKKRGIEVFQREVLESALMLGEKALIHQGFGAYQAKQAAFAFRDHEIELFNALYEAGGLEKRVSIYRQAKDELEHVLTADEEELAQRRKQGWD